MKVFDSENNEYDSSVLVVYMQADTTLKPSRWFSDVFYSFCLSLVQTSGSVVGT